MKVSRDTVRSEVLDLTDKELAVIQNYFNEFECGSKLYNEEDKSLYTGLVLWLERQGVCVEEVGDLGKIDIRTLDVDETILSQRVLRDYQKAAVRKSLYFGRGIIQVSTGGGKTEIAAALYGHLSFYGFAQTAVIRDSLIEVIANEPSTIEPHIDHFHQLTL